MKFSEEQIAQLLSAFWMQASLPDNLPANIEAIAHSFVLTLLSSGVKVKFHQYAKHPCLIFPQLFIIFISNASCFYVPFCAVRDDASLY